MTNGSTIRLGGQGGEGVGGGAAGDLLLKVNIAPDARFRLDPDRKHDLIATLPIAPWEAVLGGKVPLATFDGDLTLTIPPGSQNGQKLRIKGKGLPKKSGGSSEHGDLYAELRVVMPRDLSEADRALWEQLRTASGFDPRGEA